MPGSFLMGSDDGPEDERPMHKINLAEFRIDRHQVTNAQFARFLDAVGTESARGEKYFDIGDETATHRGRHVSRNFRSGHHNIGFRCAR
jgi:formylglycine-generating enzyme required for sulfatase activity